MQRLRTYRKDYRKAVKGNNKVAAAKALRTSVCELIDSKDLDIKGFGKYYKLFKTEMKGLIQTLQLGEKCSTKVVSLNTLIEKLEQKQNSVEKTSDDRMLEYTHELKQTLQKLSVQQIHDAAKRQGIVFAEASVLPILVDALQPHSLRDHGIKFSTFANYIVLTHQKVIAFTKDNASQVPNLMKNLKGARLVTKKPFSAKGVTWYWLTDDLVGLVKCTPNFELSSWSPFIPT